MGNKIIVYNYWTWVPGEGLGQIPKAKRPLRQIEAMGGLTIHVSGEEVDEDELCQDGAYRPHHCTKLAAEAAGV